MFFESGFIVLVNRLGKIISSKESCDHENILGTVTGWLSLIMIIIISAKRLCKARKRVKIKKQPVADVVI